MIQLQLMGSEPLFVLQLLKPTSEMLLFSTQEMAPEELQHVVDDEGDPIFEGNPVLGYVENFSQFSSVQQIEGFGSVQTMTVTFNDNLGYFKTLLETTDIYSYSAIVYLIIRQPMIDQGRQPPSWIKLFCGRVGSPITWKEGERQLDITLTAGVVYKEFGYVPEFLGVQGIEANLNAEPWPHIFGTVRLYELISFCNTAIAHTDRNIHLVRYMPERRLINTEGEEINLSAGYPSYINTPEDNYFRGDSAQEPLPNPPILNDMPFLEYNQLPFDVNEWFDISIPGGSMLCQGTATYNELQVSRWNVPWYTAIACWSPVQYNPLGTYRQDDIGYTPNVITMLGYGNLSPEENWQFNIYDDLYGYHEEINPTFPIDLDIPAGSPGWWNDIENWTKGLNTPWMKDLFIRFKAVHVYSDQQNLPAFVTQDFWARVVDQEKYNLYIDEIRTIEGYEANLTGWRIIHIYEALKNKVLMPDTSEPILREHYQVMPQQSQENPESYLDHRLAVDFSEYDQYFGIFDLAFTIPAGSEIKTVSWWPTLMYPLSLDLETYYVEVYIKIGKRLIQLDRKSQYALLRFVRTGPSVSDWEYQWYRPDLTDPDDVLRCNQCGQYEDYYLHKPEEPEGQADYHRYDPDGGLWQGPIKTGATTPVTDGMVIPAITNNMPDEITFILLSRGTYLQMLKDLSAEDPLATIIIYAKNRNYTDELAFEFLVNKYTSYIPTLNADYYHHPVGFGAREKDDDVTQFLSRLAFEHAKQIRIQCDQLNLADLLNLDRHIAFTFTEKYVEARSLEITYTNDEDIINYVVITAQDNWAQGQLVIRNEESIARTQEHKRDIAILSNRIFDTYVGGSGYDPGDPRAIAAGDWTPGPLGDGFYPRGYNLVMYFWLYMWSNVWEFALFNTYLEAADLVGADYIHLNLTQQLEFLPQDEAGIMQFTQGGDGLERLPNSKGIVLEMGLNPTDWTVSLQVQLSIIQGEER